MVKTVVSLLQITMVKSVTRVVNSDIDTLGYFRGDTNSIAFNIKKVNMDFLRVTPSVGVS